MNKDDWHHGVNYKEKNQNALFSIEESIEELLTLVKEILVTNTHDDREIFLQELRTICFVSDEISATLRGIYYDNEF
ncbi:hypothetical protein HC928_04165 [bacterium]|nr:hypothetical protein [bacterium]